MSAMAQSTFHSTRLPLVPRLMNRVGDALAARGRVPVRLDADALIRAAERSAGLSDWGGDEFREPLARWLRSVEDDGDPTPFGRSWVRTIGVTNLVARLHITDTLKRQPEIRQVPLRRPLFIIGFPRTGSTLLHNLLAQDPAVRALCGGEMNNPCPPPTPKPSLQRRMDAVRASVLIKIFLYLSPGFRTGHNVHPALPDECIHLLWKTFLDIHYFQSFAAYGYYDWFIQQDLRSAYEYYRTTLQIMMLHYPDKRLVLKYPYHAFSLDILLDLFPDAHIVWTHRDPCKTIPSISMLCALAQRTVTRRVDLPRIGKTLLDYNARCVLRATDARKRAAPGQCVDVHYLDLLHDPIAAVEGIYRPPATRSAMRPAAGCRAIWPTTHSTSTACFATAWPTSTWTPTRCEAAQRRTARPTASRSRIEGTGDGGRTIPATEPNSSRDPDHFGSSNPSPDRLSWVHGSSYRNRHQWRHRSRGQG